MASALHQLIRPGERVIYRTPRPWPPRYQRWHGLTFLAIGLGLFAVNHWTAFDWGTLTTPPAIALIIVLVLFSVATLLHKQWIELAVTDQRVMRVDTTGEQLKFRSIELAEIGKVEVLYESVEVTKHDGNIVILEHSQHAADIARAVVQTAGLPHPRPLEPWAKIATYLVNIAGLVTGLGTYFVVIRAFASAGLMASFPLCLLAILPAVPSALAAWLLGELLALLLARRFISRAEIERCFQLLGLISRDPAKPDHPSWFGRMRLRIFDLVYGPPVPREARHGN